MASSSTHEAYDNFRALSRNSYPGRGAVMGRDHKGKNMVQVYWIMGRGTNSRNRIFKDNGGGTLSTEAVDPAKLEDPSLIIYNAMREGDGFYIVSNGEQTNRVFETLGTSNGTGLTRALHGYKYEPDAPNFTPRIAGVCFSRPEPLFQLSILRKSPWNDTCDRLLYEYEWVADGFGYGITTYSGDGNPLPAFRGEPALLPFFGDIDDVANAYWEALNEANRVSLAVKFIAKSGWSEMRIINKYTKVVS